MAGFFDKVGATLNTAKDKVVAGANTASDKMKNLKEVSDLNGQLKAAEKALTDDYVALGKQYFEKIKENPEAGAKDIVSSIQANLGSIENLKALISQAKGVKVCPECGAEIPTGTMFCSACGAKVEDPAPVEAPASNEKTCPKCGAKMNADAKFCTGCGSKVEE